MCFLYFQSQYRFVCESVHAAYTEKVKAQQKGEIHTK